MHTLFTPAGSGRLVLCLVFDSDLFMVTIFDTFVNILNQILSYKKIFFQTAIFFTFSTHFVSFFVLGLEKASNRSAGSYFRKVD